MLFLESESGYNWVVEYISNKLKLIIKDVNYFTSHFNHFI